MWHFREQIVPAVLLVLDFGGWYRLDTKSSNGNSSDMIYHTQVSLLNDVIVPYTHLLPRLQLSENQKRHTLLYFKGAKHRTGTGLVSNNLTLDLAALCGFPAYHPINKRVIMEEGFPNATGREHSIKGMRSSEFCLHPAGDTPTSCRLFDAIQSFCIPVIVSDNIELPFEGKPVFVYDNGHPGGMGPIPSDGGVNHMWRKVHQKLPVIKEAIVREKKTNMIYHTQVSLLNDVIVPYTHLLPRLQLSENQKRHTLLYFKGAKHRTGTGLGGLVREKLWDLLVNKPGVIMEEGFPNATGREHSIKGMRSSEFCLHPAGDTPTSCRLFDAIQSFCIPVIVSDNIELPFEGKPVFVYDNGHPGGMGPIPSDGGVNHMWRKVHQKLPVIKEAIVREKKTNMIYHTQVSLLNDVIVPYTHLLPRLQLSENQKRHTLLYFKGAKHRTGTGLGGLVREKLWDLLVNKPGVIMEEGFPNATGREHSIKGMRSSEFCLHPAGDTPTSCRLFDAIQSFCIPVIVSDNIELPFEGKPVFVYDNGHPGGMGPIPSDGGVNHMWRKVHQKLPVIKEAIVREKKTSEYINSFTMPLHLNV
ncbi:hypothetical protein CRYUN_Cryun27aG0021200 [Craigia yunnanensis]